MKRQIILRKNKKDIPPIQTDDRLKEMFFGEQEGLGLTKENFEIPSEHFNDFYDNPFAFQNSASGESIQQVCARTGEFYQELIKRYCYETILLTTHGFALRAMLQQVYETENKEDFQHGKVPDNCAVNIIEVKDGKSVLVGDDVIYYNPSLCVNPYKPVQRNEQVMQVKGRSRKRR